MRKSNRLSKSILKNLTVLFFVVLWVIPTFGLVVSSFRDKEVLTSSGWWTAFSASERNLVVRTKPSSEQVFENEQYVIRGNFFKDGEVSDGLADSTVLYLGLKVNNPKEFLLEGVNGENGGVKVEIGETDFSLKPNGDYEWVSKEKITSKRGRRIYLVAEVPTTFTFANYFEVLSTQGIGRAFVNSFTVTIPATIIPILIAAFAAYAFSWMTFIGRSFIFSFIIALLVVPLQMSLIPILTLYNDVGKIFDVQAKGYVGIWLAHIGFGLPLAFYLLYNYISSLPKDLMESARIDGADHFKIFTKIVLPLSVPALASFAIFQFLWVWNDLLVALVFLSKSDSHIVLTSQLRELLGSRGGNWEVLTASAFVSIVVPLLVFVSLQRYFVRGLLSGSVK